MPRIEVCLGSSCFLKGAYIVLDTFHALLRQRGLQQQITLAGAFCKEKCRDGVSVEIDGTVYSVPDSASARALFAELFPEPTEPS